MSFSWHSKRLRKVLGGLVGLLAVWLIFKVSMNVLAWHFILRTSKDNPNLDVVPVPLPNEGQAKLNGMQLTAFEYSLQSPWADIDTRKDSSSVSTWYFKRGATVVLFQPSKTNENVGLLRGRSESDSEKIARVLGAHTLSSDYDLLKAELNATPSQVHWWSARAAKVRSIVLLNLKSTEITMSALTYPQCSREMHGFQFGDPNISPYKIELDLFDRNDRRYRLWILSRGTSRTFITQPEINAMVASLKPIPHS